MMMQSPIPHNNRTEQNIRLFRHSAYILFIVLTKILHGKEKRKEEKQIIKSIIT